MKKALGTAILVVMTLGAGTAISQETRMPARETMRPQPQARLEVAGDQRARMDAAMMRARGCKTVKCINKSFKVLFKITGQLWHLVWECERVVPITQYMGYDYDGVVSATTALDYTAEGHTASDWMLVDICQ